MATLTVGDDEVRIFTVRADEGLQRHLVTIAARLPPAAGRGRAVRAVARLACKRQATRPTTAARSRPTPTPPRPSGRSCDIRARRKALEEDEDVLETAIKTRMADAAALVGDGFRVTWKRTKDRTETDWKSLASGLLAPMPETERAALVGLHSTVREGFRPFRVSMGKEDAS